MRSGQDQTRVISDSRIAPVTAIETCKTPSLLFYGSGPFLNIYPIPSNQSICFPGPLRVFDVQPIHGINVLSTKSRIILFVRGGRQARLLSFEYERLPERLYLKEDCISSLITLPDWQLHSILDIRLGAPHDDTLRLLAIVVTAHGSIIAHNIDAHHGENNDDAW